MELLRWWVAGLLSLWLIIWGITMVMEPNPPAAKVKTLSELVPPCEVSYTKELSMCEEHHNDP